MSVNIYLTCQLGANGPIARTMRFGAMDESASVQNPEEHTIFQVLAVYGTRRRTVKRCSAPIAAPAFDETRHTCVALPSTLLTKKKQIGARRNSPRPN